MKGDLHNVLIRNVEFVCADAHACRCIFSTTLRKKSSLCGNDAQLANAVVAESFVLGHGAYPMWFEEMFVTRNGDNVSYEV